MASPERKSKLLFVSGLMDLLPTRSDCFNRETMLDEVSNPTTRLSLITGK